jgi:hypothetical protein
MASKDRNDSDIIDTVAQSMGATAKLPTFTRRYTFTEVAALGAVLTGTIDPAGFPANVRVVDVTTRIPVAFAGTTTMVIDVGDVANTDELVDNADLQVADLTGVHQPGDATYTPLTHEAAYAPRVTFTSTVENLDQASAGVVELTWTYHGAAPAEMLGAGDDTIVKV